MSLTIRPAVREDAPVLIGVVNAIIEAGGTTAHQTPFDVNHESVADLHLVRNQPAEDLAVAVRRAFSAIVTGNVKDQGIRAIKRQGPFQLRADAELTDALDRLLRSFANSGRMRLHGEYEPCYQVVASATR